MKLHFNLCNIKAVLKFNKLSIWLFKKCFKWLRTHLTVDIRLLLNQDNQQILPELCVDLTPSDKNKRTKIFNQPTRQQYCIILGGEYQI